MNDLKLFTGARAHHRLSNTIPRLIALTVCLNLAIMPSIVFAIDVPVGAFTASSATTASSALSAVRTATGFGPLTGVAVAAVGAFGVGFCTTSYFEGSNSCGVGGGSMAAGLAAAGISIPDNTAQGGAIGVPAVQIDPVGPCAKYYVTYPVPAGHTCRDVPHPSAAMPSTRCALVTRVDINSSYHVACYDYKNNLRPATPEEMGNALAGANAPPAARAATAAAAAAAAAHPEASDSNTGTKAGAVASAQTAAHESDCAGKKQGTFNGAIVCVDPAAPPATETPTGTPAETTDTGTGTGTDTGTATPPATTAPATLPAFCGWATTVCTWIGWTQTAPAPVTTSTKVDVAAVDLAQSPLSDIAIDQQRIVFNSQCPPDIPMSFTMFGQSASYAFSYDPLCQFMTKLKPFVVAAAYMTGAYIIAGTGRGSNDG
jgi:hypothetical protein